LWRLVSTGREVNPGVASAPAIVSAQRGPQASFPLAAQSWGGAVRSGPGAGSSQLASLREREPITILEQSDAPFYQDLPWFKISYRGRVGYHWGGIICPVGVSVPGTFQVC
ncbi:MAG: SH3 domain-containing protein, partial [Bradyrhizobium sp.]|nr:SH3 domain-containing protein [Bradyrhizobium sp.]